MEVGEKDRRTEADDKVDKAAGDEIHGDVERRAHHAEVEVAGHRQVGGQFAAFQMGDAWRCHAYGDEPVVQVGRHPPAEVRRHHLMERLGDQQQGERHADHDQWTGKRRASGDCTDQPAERN